MFGSNTYSSSAYETDANQGRLGYYKDDASRKKTAFYQSTGYWLASPSSTGEFCAVKDNGSIDKGSGGWPFPERGAAPAFAVK
jgi:hypothetical protein